MSEKENFYFFDLLKESIRDSEASVGGRIVTGIIGLVGTVVVDPIKLGMNALGVKDENSGPDPSDPTDPRNPGAY